MSVNKPDLNRVWANGAPTGNVVDPDTTTPGKFNTGWQAEIPPFEHFNFIQKLVTQSLAHINERGVPEWDNSTVYLNKALARASDGEIYQATEENSNSDPVLKIKWKLYILDDLSTTDSSVPVGGVPAGELSKSAMQREHSNLSPVMLDQFVNYLGGRGMLAAETPSIITEQNITSSAAAGATSVALADTANMVVGARIMIYHSGVDLYEPYFITSKSASTIGMSSGLRHPVTANISKIERLWYNQPHPGKFYMRMLAQKIARLPASELSTPSSGRLYFSQFDSDPTDANDLATGIGSGTVAYVNELNVSQGDIAKPLESMIGRALFIEGSADGFGAELPLFRTYGVTDAVLSIAIMCRNPAIDIEIRLIDTDGFVQTVIPVDKTQLRNMGLYRYPIKLSGRTEQLKVQVVASGGVTAATSIIVDQIEICQASAVDVLPIIDKTKPCKIVGLGDSWIAGDTTQSERESILTQLAIELPNATIINAGVGGQKVWEMYNRFETDVAVHEPDYVIVNTGTNDAYSPISGTFFPNSVDQFERYYNLLIGKIMAIGAKPIIIGVPALAEEDGARVNWELNDKAKTYYRYFYKRLSQVVDYTPPVEPVPEPVITEFTPVLKINNSETGITYTSRTGNYSQNGRVVTFTINITLSAKGASTGLVTIDMPPVTNSGGVTPFTTVVNNVTSALGMYAIGSIGATGQMRLHIPSATGNDAATEANITDTTIIRVSGSYLAAS